MKPHHIRWILIVMLLVLAFGMVLGRAAEMPQAVGSLGLHSPDPGRVASSSEVMLDLSKAIGEIAHGAIRG